MWRPNYCATFQAIPELFSVVSLKCIHTFSYNSFGSFQSLDSNVGFQNYLTYKFFYLSFKSLYWWPTFLGNYRIVSILSNLLVAGTLKTLSKSIQGVYNLVYSGLFLISYIMFFSTLEAGCTVVKLLRIQARAVYFKSRLYNQIPV